MKYIYIGKFEKRIRIKSAKQNVLKRFTERQYRFILWIYMGV